MPNRTRAQIQTDINTKLATNGSGAITALKLREVVTDIIDSSPIKLDEPKADSTHTHVATAISDSTAAGRAILTAADSSAQRTSLGLGTSAVLNVPASGNAASGEVVKGNDTRLTDTRTPSAHTHPSTDISDSTVAGRALLTGASASAQRTSLGLGTGATLDVPASGDASASQLVKGNDSRLGGSGGGWSKTVVEIASEFVENVPPAAGWTQSTSGTGAATAALETDQTAIGVHQLSTGTTATGRAGFFRSSLSIRFGGGEVLFKHRVRVNQLSDGTNRFIIRVGTGDNASGDNADGIYFEYDDTASANCVVLLLQTAFALRTPHR